MKVAQHEVLGNDAKRNVRPGRDDRNIWLLISLMPLTRVAALDRPIRDGRFLKR